MRGLRILPSANLLEVSRTWQQQFSVERVTTKFYQEYAAVRDRIAKALLVHNQDHSVVKFFTQDEARAWATRQMGRVLFLWFLQAKRWLGEPGGQGSITYLLDPVGPPVPTPTRANTIAAFCPPCFSTQWRPGAAAGANIPSWASFPT